MEVAAVHHHNRVSDAQRVATDFTGSVALPTIEWSRRHRETVVHGSVAVNGRPCSLDSLARYWDLGGRDDSHSAGVSHQLTASRPYRTSADLPPVSASPT